MHTRPSIDSDLIALLRELLDAGFMLDDDPGFDEAVKVRDCGIGALTDAEREVYGREVRPVLEAYAQSRAEDAIHGCKPW
jgi:hypothetical protein